MDMRKTSLFASLMSTVDSLFNSLSTLFSIDIYKEYINTDATDKELIAIGRRTILVTLCSGILVGSLLLYYKLSNPADAFTHTLNELRYYINCGIVVLICSVVFLVKPSWRLVLAVILLTVPVQLYFKYAFPEMNYFVRAGWVMLIALLGTSIPTIIRNGLKSPSEFINFATPQLKYYGYGLLASMFLIHWVFH